MGLNKKIQSYISYVLFMMQYFDLCTIFILIFTIFFTNIVKHKFYYVEYCVISLNLYILKISLAFNF